MDYTFVEQIVSKTTLAKNHQLIDSLWNKLLVLMKLIDVPEIRASIYESIKIEYIKSEF